MTMRSLLILVCTLALSSATKFKHCWGHDQSAKVKSLDISGCPDEIDNCLLVGDNTKTLTFEFEMLKDEEGFRLYKNPYPVYQKTDVSARMPDYPCDDNGLECPLKKGETYKYTGTFTIDYYSDDPKPEELSFYWSFMDLDLQFELLCFRMDNNINGGS